LEESKKKQIETFFWVHFVFFFFVFFFLRSSAYAMPREEEIKCRGLLK